MRPCLRGIIQRTPTCCVSRNTPVRLSPMTLFQPSSGCSSAGAPQVAPALLTRMSMGAPAAAATASTKGFTFSGRDRSPTTRTAVTPRSRCRLRHRRVELVGLARGDDDLRAHLAERARHREAQSARAAGDQRRSAFEVEGITHAHAGSLHSARIASLTAAEVMHRIAEGHVDHGQALEIVADRELVGHAHAAMQLDRLLAHEARGPADVVLGRGDVAPAQAASSRSSWTWAAHRPVARMLIERAWVACTNMSAMRCCSAWKRPIGWPNCLRDLVYSMVVAFVASMAPTASAHSAAMPRSTARSSSAVASPSPSSLARGQLHVVEGHIGGTASVLRAIAHQANAWRIRIDQEHREPVRRSCALTRSRSATPPSGTVAFAPLST